MAKKKKKSGKISWILEVSLFLLLVVSLTLLVVYNPLKRKAVNYKSAETEMEEAEIPAEQKNERKINLSQIHSYAGIVLRLRDGKVITQFRENERIFPASLTKIMTCIIAIEKIDDIQEVIPVEAGIFPDLYSRDASMAGFLPGEQAKAIDLLYGMILPSGGECSVAVAEYTAGSEETFVAWMNEKAQELGMNDTHFSNVTGLHEESHYSTVKDLSTVLKYALKNETFKKIFETRSYSVSPTNQHPEGFTFYSSVFQLQENWILDNGEIKGGKTGYTDKAGLCLATEAVIENNEYIAVTAKADGNYSTEPYHVYDAFCLYDQI